MIPLALITAGLLSALGFMLIALKINRKLLLRILGYDWIIDIGVTGLFMWFMAGTFSGSLVAIINGICISLVLWLGKNIMGYEVIDFSSRPYKWKAYPSTWTFYNVFKYLFKFIYSVIIHK